MIRKTLTYLDYEGQEHTKDFYFSLNQTEFALMNNRLPGGFESYLKRIQEDHNEEKLLDLLTMFIVEGYGIRESDDDFVKEDEQGRKLGKRFKCTEACDNLLTELLEKENNVAAFLIGMLPKSIQKNADARFKEAMAKDGNVSALPVANPSANT